MNLRELREWLSFGKSVLPFLDKYAPSSRRWLFVLILVLSFVTSPTFSITTQWFKLVTGPKIEAALDSPLPSALKFAYHGWLPLSCLIGCGIFSYLFCVALTVFIRSVTTLSPAKSKSLILVDQLMYRLGILELFPSSKKDIISQQAYAPVINAAVANSQNVRLLSIAGYEYLGRGADSLLFTTILRHPEINFRIILLDADTPVGIGVIENRVQELTPRDSMITTQQIIDNIKSTVSSIRHLAKNRTKGRVELRKCQWHPIFRLVLCDDVLFLSAYGKAVHGHETPVLQILKTSPDGTSSDTLYHSWDNYFESLWNNSKPVTL